MNQRRPKFPPLYDDELALPDLAQWVAFYGGYEQIPTWAWVEWDRLCEVRQRMQKLSAGEAGTRKSYRPRRDKDDQGKANRTASKCTGCC